MFCVGFTVVGSAEGGGCKAWTPSCMGRECCALGMFVQRGEAVVLWDWECVWGMWEGTGMFFGGSGAVVEHRMWECGRAARGNCGMGWG